MGGKVAKAGCFQLNGVDFFPERAICISEKRSDCAVIIKFSHGKKKIILLAEKRGIGNGRTPKGSFWSIVESDIGLVFGAIAGN